MHLHAPSLTRIFQSHLPWLQQDPLRAREAYLEDADLYLVGIT